MSALASITPGVAWASTLDAADLSTPAAQYLLRQTPEGQSVMSALFPLDHKWAPMDLLSSKDPLAAEIVGQAHDSLKALFDHRASVFHIRDQTAPLTQLDRAILKIYANVFLGGSQDEQGAFKFARRKRIKDLDAVIQDTEAAREALGAHSVRYVEKNNRKGDLVFEIVPDRGAGASELNALAQEMTSVHQKLYYSLDYLKKKNARAYFSGEDAAVYLSNRTILNGSADAETGHEMLHGMFNVSLEAGNPSIFYGRLGRVFGRDEVSSTPLPYLRSYSLEELATHAYQLHLYAHHLSKIKDPHSEEATHLIAFAQNSSENAAMTGAFTHEILVRGIEEAGKEKSWVGYSSLKNDHGKLMGFLARLQFQDERGALFEAAIPLIGVDDLALFSRYDRVDIFERELRQRLKDQLTEKVIDHLKALDQVTLILSQQFDDLAAHFSALPTQGDRGQWVQKFSSLAELAMKTAGPEMGFDPKRVQDCMLPRLRAFLQMNQN